MDFLKIAGKDIKSIFKNRFIRVCVIAIIVVPLLYSLLYLDAFWDPYSKLANMPVAVVNLDEGTELDGETVKYGEGIIENLKSNDSVGWKFVSQEEADKGLEGDKYYAKFEISKDFSQKIVSAKSGIPTQAGLKFVCNEKKNFLASQVNSKVESALKAQIVETITNNYVTVAFDNLYTVKDGMSAAADGSGQLKDGLQTLNGSVPALEDGVAKLNSGSSQLYTGQTALNNGISQINGGLGSLNNKVPELAYGISRISKGTNDLYNGYNTKVIPGIDQLIGGLQGFKAQVETGEIGSKTQIKQASALLTAKGTVLNDKSTELVQKPSISNAEFQEYLITLKDYSDTVTTIFGSVGSQIATNTTSVKAGVQQSIDGATLLKNKLNNDFKPGLEQLNDGAAQLNSKVPELAQGVSKLYEGSSDALAGSNKLVEGQTQLKDGLGTLSAKVPELVSGVTKLYDGSAELSTKLSDGSSKLSSGLINTSEDMGSFVSSPVELKIEPINAVPNYGTGFAPYFINLSLWIGAIMMFFVITTKTEEHSESTRFAKAFGKYLSFGFVGVLQAVLVGIAVLLLGLKPTSIPLYFATIIFFSLVYVAIVQCLISLFGDAGRLLSIVFLILQLTACAGTFPLELVPHFFVVLNPLMPFTYSVEALREITSAATINYSVVFRDLAILGVVLVAFLTSSIVFHRLGEKMQSAIEGKKEEAM